MPHTPKMFLHNLGGRFGYHGEDDDVEARIKHPIFGLAGLADRSGATAENFSNGLFPRAIRIIGDVYEIDAVSPATKEQLLADPFVVEGSFDNPPSEVLEAILAEFMTVSASYRGVEGSIELRRGYSRSIVDGDLVDGAAIDDFATRLYQPDSANINDYVEAYPNASYWAIQYGSTSPFGVIANGGTYISKYLLNTSLGQSNSEEGEPVALYEVETGIPIGDEGTYKLKFEGVIDSVSTNVDIRWHQSATHVAKHGVWILPFSAIGYELIQSSLSVIVDTGYDLIMSGEYAEDLAEIEAEEYAEFAEDNPDETHVALPLGLSRFFTSPTMSSPPVTEAPVTASYSTPAFHVTFLDAEMP